MYGFEARGIQADDLPGQRTLRNGRWPPPTVSCLWPGPGRFPGAASASSPPVTPEGAWECLLGGLPAMRSPGPRLEQPDPAGGGGPRTLHSVRPAGDFTGWSSSSPSVSDPWGPSAGLDLWAPRPPPPPVPSAPYSSARAKAGTQGCWASAPRGSGSNQPDVAVPTGVTPCRPGLWPQPRGRGHARCPRSSERCGRQPRAGPVGSRPEPEASRDADSGAAWPRRRPAHGLFVVWSSRSERGLGGNGRHAAASRQGGWETKAPAAPASGSLSLCLSGFPGCRDPRGRLGRPVDAAVGGSGGAGYPRLDALRRRLRSRRAVPRGPVLSGPSAPRSRGVSSCPEAAARGCRVAATAPGRVRV